MNGRGNLLRAGAGGRGEARGGHHVALPPESQSLSRRCGGRGEESWCSPKADVMVDKVRIEFYSLWTAALGVMPFRVMYKIPGF